MATSSRLWSRCRWARCPSTSSRTSSNRRSGRQVSDAAYRLRVSCSRTGRLERELDRARRGRGRDALSLSHCARGRGGRRWVVIDGTPILRADQAPPQQPARRARRRGARSRERGSTRPCSRRTCASHRHGVAARRRHRARPAAAGLVGLLVEHGRAGHLALPIGIDEPNEMTREAWIPRPYVAKADACVFSRKGYVWDGLARDRTSSSPRRSTRSRPRTRSSRPSTSTAILEAAGISRTATSGDPVHARGRHARRGSSRQGPVWQAGAAVPRTTGRGPGLALGPAQGPARGDPGFVDTSRRRPTRTWCSPARRSRRSPTIPRARRYSPRPGPVRPPRPRHAAAGPPRDAADGRPRGERGDRQRPAAPRRRRGARRASPRASG